MKKIRAFNAEGMFAKIIHNDEIIRLTECKIINNSQIIELYKNYPEKTIIDKYGGEYFLYKTKGKLLQYRTRDFSKIKIGEKITIGL